MEKLTQKPSICQRLDFRAILHEIASITISWLAVSVLCQRVHVLVKVSVSQEKDVFVHVTGADEHFLTGCNVV